MDDAAPAGVCVISAVNIFISVSLQLIPFTLHFTGSNFSPSADDSISVNLNHTAFNADRQQKSTAALFTAKQRLVHAAKNQFISQKTANRDFLRYSSMQRHTYRC